MKRLRKTRKYTIHWHECHNPENWGKTEKEGIKAIMASVPPGSKWRYDSYDGWCAGK